MSFKPFAFIMRLTSTSFEPARFRSDYRFEFVIFFVRWPNHVVVYLCLRQFFSNCFASLTFQSASPSSKRLSSMQLFGNKSKNQNKTPSIEQFNFQLRSNLSMRSNWASKVRELKRKSNWSLNVNCVSPKWFTKKNCWFWSASFYRRMQIFRRFPMMWWSMRMCLQLQSIDLWEEQIQCKYSNWRKWWSNWTWANYLKT